MSTDQIVALTQKLGEHLTDMNAAVRITIVGGAAVALGVNPDRAGTVDIDVFCTNRDLLNQVASDIAAEEGLPPTWLNSGAQQFMSQSASHVDLQAVFKRDGVLIERLDDRSLLAMKLRSGRIGKDFDDIEQLCTALSISSVQEARTILDDYYDGEEQIKPAALDLLQELFA